MPFKLIKVAFIILFHTVHQMPKKSLECGFSSMENMDEIKKSVQMCFNISLGKNETENTTFFSVTTMPSVTSLSSTNTTSVNTTNTVNNATENIDIQKESEIKASTESVVTTTMASTTTTVSTTTSSTNAPTTMITTTASPRKKRDVFKFLANNQMKEFEKAIQNDTNKTEDEKNCAIQCILQSLGMVRYY